MRDVLPANYRQTSPGVLRDYFWSYDRTTDRIVRIDAETGTVTPLGNPASIGVPVDMHGLTYTRDGELYAMSGHNNSLYRIDTETGAATQIRGTGVTLAWGMAYDAVTDTIYGLATPPGFAQGSVQPIIYDRRSGGVSFIGNRVTTGVPATNGIAFDPVTRRLLVFDSSDRELLAFDVTTGVGSSLATNLPINGAGLADDGLGNVVLASPVGLARINTSTFAITPLTGPLSNYFLESLEFVNLEPFAHHLYIGPATQTSGLDFGNQSILGDLRGTKFHDLDGDGSRDVGEPSLPGVVVYLDANNNAQLDAGELSTTTDSQGAYAFLDLVPGKYVVRETLPFGYEQTSPGMQRDFYWGFDSQMRRIVKIDAASGQVTPVGEQGSIGIGFNIHGLVQTIDGQLFGISGQDNALYSIDPQTGLATRIGSPGVALAWALTYDPVTDTIYGAARPRGAQSGLQLVTFDRTTGAVTYLGSNPAPDITGTTGMAFDPTTQTVLLFDRSNNGRLFSVDPVTGDWEQLLTSLQLFAFGLADDGAGQLILPINNQLVRLNPTTGELFPLVGLSQAIFLEALEEVDQERFAHVVYLPPAGEVTGLDFGNRSVLSSLRGVKFEDNNGDGQRQAEEGPLADVSIYLDLNQDGQLTDGEPSALTDANGDYAFANLLPGRYVVREVVPEGYAASPISGPNDYLVGYDISTRQIVSIDPLTGAVSTLVDMANYPVLNGIVRTNANELFGLSGQTNTLFKIDPHSATVTVVGSAGRYVAWGLAYDAATDRIFGLAHPGSDLEQIALAEYDRLTGLATIVGPPLTGVRYTSGLTFDPVQGKVIAFDNSEVRELYAFDPVTGIGELLPGSLPMGPSYGLAADNQGQLIVQANNNVLARFNPTTGEPSFYLQLSRPVVLEALEFIDFAEGGHDVYLEPRTALVGLDFGNRQVDAFDVGPVSDTNAAANSVAENVANETVVGVTAFASDSDMTNNEITYTLTDDAGGRFAINASSGDVTVADGSLLDREAASSHNITVLATSADGSTSHATFTINLTDVDEFDVGGVVDTNAATDSVAENAANGTIVGITAFASDADATTNGILYSLTDDAGGRFAISASTGVVTVSDSSLLNRGLAASHQITIGATSADGSTSTATFTISLTNVAPSNVVINASAPALEGSPVTLTGSFDDHGSYESHAVEIDWGDGLLQSLQLSPGTKSFTANHPYADNRAGGYTVRVSVRDSSEGTASAEQVVLVSNVAPVASVSGSATGVRGFARTFTFAAADASAADQAAAFDYVINWGDGSPAQVVNGSSSISVEHVFTASGSFQVQVRATDKDGGTSGLASRSIAIAGATLQGTTLLIGGTPGADSIALRPSGTTGVSVTINGVSQGTFASPTQIHILGLAGNDTILLEESKVKKTTTYIAAPAVIDGGEGDDMLDARGSTANNTLLGGEGADTLYGGGSRDLLIGGLGADVLRAGGGDDILIGGTTTFDTNLAALASLLAEWGRTNLGYAARVDHLTGATAGGLNGGNYLTASTVRDDAAVDQLYGEGNQDWFLYRSAGNSRDLLRDRKSNERTTNI